MKSIIKILSMVLIFATNWSLIALADQNSTKAKVEYCQHAEQELPQLLKELKNTKDPKKRENLQKRIKNLQHEEENCKDILKKK